MLRALAIRNVVLIDALTLDFTAGLTALTGETGAGKSILLDALGLALGERSDAGLVRTGADSASVAATFAPAGAAVTLLREQGIDTGDDIVLRRTLGRDGKSKAFVNDTPVTVALLRQLGSLLVEVEGQFGVHALLQPAQHRNLLDSFGNHAVQPVAAAYAALAAAQAALAALESEYAAAQRERTWLEESVAELQALAPQDGEEDDLLARRAALQSRDKVLQHLQGAWGALASDSGAEMQLGGAQRAMQRLADVITEPAAAALAALDRASDAVAEAVRVIESEQEKLTVRGMDAESLDDRLYKIRAAARKYQCTPATLAATAAEMEQRLALVTDFDAQIRRARQNQSAALTAYTAAAATLAAQRHATAKIFAAAVMAELAPLKLEKAAFGVALSQLDQPSPAGSESVGFTVAINPGSPPTPLHKTASGGELARLLLAIKVVLAAANPVPTLVFDEADTGLGGATASAVGERLARLAGTMQIVAITHSPQVAALAKTHFKISKQETRSGITTSVDLLPPAERREEVARMLAGATVTDAARAAADTLLAPPLAAEPRKKSA